MNREPGTSEASVSARVVRAAVGDGLRADRERLMSTGMEYPLDFARGIQVETKRILRILSHKATYREGPDVQ